MNVLAEHDSTLIIPHSLQYCHCGNTQIQMTAAYIQNITTTVILRTWTPSPPANTYMLLQFLQHLAQVLSPVLLSRPQLVFNGLAEIVGLSLQLFADAINVVQLQRTVQVKQDEDRHTHTHWYVGIMHFSFLCPLCVYMYSDAAQAQGKVCSSYTNFIIPSIIF